MLGGVFFEGVWGRRIEVIVKMQEEKSEGEALARLDVTEELKIEERIDVNEELKLWRKCKKSRRGSDVRLGGQGGCEKRIEVIVKMQKVGGGPDGVVRVDVNKELKSL